MTLCTYSVQWTFYSNDICSRPNKISTIPRYLPWPKLFIFRNMCSSSQPRHPCLCKNKILHTKYVKYSDTILLFFFFFFGILNTFYVGTHNLKHFKIILLTHWLQGLIWVRESVWLLKINLFTIQIFFHTYS